MIFQKLTCALVRNNIYLAFQAWKKSFKDCILAKYKFKLK